MIQSYNGIGCSTRIILKNPEIEKYSWSIVKTMNKLKNETKIILKNYFK